MRAAFSGIGRIEAQHEAIVLDRRAAARRRDDDRVEPAAFDLAGPDIDVAARRFERGLLAAHMVDQRAAAGLALGHHDLDAEPGQQPDRRLVDAGIQHRLRAAGEDRDAAAPRAGGGMDGRRRHRRLRGQSLRAPAPASRANGFSAGTLSRTAGERPAEPRQRQRGAKAAGIRQHPGQHGADQPVEQRPPVGLLDMGAGMVDQMHVVHARRAGRHAGEAGQAAVDMGDDLLVGRPAVLQHVLDQVDAAARAESSSLPSVT